MNAKQFLAEFSHIANATGGVSKLRSLVIELAVQGKLVSNTSSINLATDLECEIARIKDSLVSKELLSREKKYPRISNNELPSKRPDNWAWPRFGDVWQLISGRDLTKSQYNANNIGIPYITGASNIESGVININRWTDSPVVVSIENDVLITCKGTIGTLAVNTIGEIHIARQIMAIRNFSGLLNTEFLNIWLESYVIKLIEKSKSMIPGFSRNDLLHAIFPLPPLEEQTRIVEKVNELMVLCGKLEQQQQQKRQFQNQLRKTSLQGLAEANSPFELKQNWQRLQDNFDQLFSEEDDVTDLRSLVLDLGVKGKLVLQDESEEPADIWLSKVIENKKSLLKKKKIAKQTVLSTINKGEFPFAPPNGWTFARLGEFTNKIGSGSTPRGGVKAYVQSGVPFLRSQNVRNNGLKLDNVAFISAETHEKMRNTALQAMDVLLNITGASLGRCALVSDYFEEANVSQHVTIIRPTDPAIVEYLHLCILSPYTQNMIWGRQVGMAREGLSKKVLEQFEIPIPPIAEQKRIVKRVSELITLCDVLEEKLKSAKNIAESLAKAVINNLTGINTTQEEKSLKTPTTELVASLKLGQNKPSSKDDAPLSMLLARQNGQMNANDLWQRFGGEIDAFYAQLKTEVVNGWIAEPSEAEMLEKDVE